MLTLLARYLRELLAEELPKRWVHEQGRLLGFHHLLGPDIYDGRRRRLDDALIPFVFSFQEVDIWAVKPGSSRHDELAVTVARKIQTSRDRDRYQRQESQAQG
jgi:hypothetical protein